MVVLAAPLAVDTDVGLNVQVTPGTDMQENETLLAKPPVGVTVTITGTD